MWGCGTSVYRNHFTFSLILRCSCESRDNKPTTVSICLQYLSAPLDSTTIPNYSISDSTRAWVASYVRCFRMDTVTVAHFMERAVAKLGKGVNEKELLELLEQEVTGE